MQGKAHFLFGLTTAIATPILLSQKFETPADVGCFSVMCIAGALLPDIDNIESKVSYRCPIISKIVNKIFGHRGFIHSILHLLLIYIIYKIELLFFPNIYMGSSLILLTLILFKMLFKRKRLFRNLLACFIIGPIITYIAYGYLYILPGFIAGIAGHLFLDLFTTEGIPPLYPIIKKTISLKNRPSGQPTEFITAIFYCLAYIGIIYIWKMAGAL